jgi:hypothetical protein
MHKQFGNKGWERKMECVRDERIVLRMLGLGEKKKNPRMRWVS